MAALLAGALLLGGCVGTRQSVPATAETSGETDPARAAAVRAIRAKAAAAEAAGDDTYPFVFDSPAPAPTEPGATDPEAIEATLTAAKDRQEAQVASGEVESLKAKARRLRKLRAEHAAQTEQAIADKAAGN